VNIFNLTLNQAFLVSVLSGMIVYATPLVLGALGGVISERAGVVNIALEGIMLTSAFACAAIGSVTQNLLVGILAGLVAGALVGLFLAVLAVSLRVDQVVGGFVINIAAAGATAFILRSAFGENVSSPALDQVNVPLLSGIPVLGPSLFQQNWLVYATVLLVPIVHVVLFRTRAGLRARSVGENPKAADVAGINVSLVRYTAVIASGALAGLGGSYLAALNQNFAETSTVQGQGFIALAAVIFGKWRPIQAALGALLFGFCQGLNSPLQGAGAPSALAPLLTMIPYVVTIVVLAGFIGRAIAPAADGIPYVKE